MELLERELALRELGVALGAATRGAGRVALVSGEAGVGKTALVDRFARAQRAEVRVLRGVCDASFYPRPLGPLHDMAMSLPSAARAPLAADADRGVIFAATLAGLRRGPTIAVFEDVHWADEATLDLLRFLGRRIEQTAALLVLTYRDDELGPRHPLRSVLGDLASSDAVSRVALSPLSQGAVRLLVGARPIDAAELHRRSGGNPFFVTESLGDDGVGVPATVSDAVLARAARLSSLAHAALETAAVIGPRVEPWLLDAIAAPGADAVERCLAGGMLVARGDLLAFRHELARQAVLEAILPPRRAAIHRLALAALRAPPGAGRDWARLAHHAAGAGDRAAVLEYAPAAARQFSSGGTHRAAAALFALALSHAEELAPADRAALLEAHAWECHCTDDLSEAIAGRQRAIALWREVGDPVRQGENLAQLAGVCINAGRRDEASRASRAAIALLEAAPPGRGLALAYRTEALFHLTNHDLAAAIALAERAIALGERAADTRIVVMAYETLGNAVMYLDYERGRRHFQHARAVALRAGLDPDVARTYANLGANAVKLFHLEHAERALAEGIAYAAERDLDTYRRHMVGWLAMAHFHRGRWPEAESAAAEVLRSPPGNAHRAALLALGRLQARRGEHVAPPPLDEALALGRESGDFQLTGPVRAARAEAAWLAGDTARVRAEVAATYPIALEKRHAWVAGELAYWRWRTGTAAAPPDWIAAPFALQIAGDWRAAAAAWGSLGCPYERARALADGDVAARAAALVAFQDLGARPDAHALRRALRASGVTHIPRGPQRAARASPFGLTARQRDILDLLAVGLSNAQIAARLFIAPKTVDHHVSAVLAKLGVHSREAAATLAGRHPTTDKI